MNIHKGRHFNNEVSIFVFNLKGRDNDGKKNFGKEMSFSYERYAESIKINRSQKGRKNMELKFVIPNMEKTFGNLEFAGEDKVIQRRINGQLTVLSRSYNLYSDLQRADDTVVILPAEAGEKNFAFEEKVKLIHPRIRAEGYKIGTRGFTNYILEADDMIKA